MDELFACAVHMGVKDAQRAAFSCRALLVVAGAAPPPPDGWVHCAPLGAVKLTGRPRLGETARTAALWFLSEHPRDAEVAETCGLIAGRSDHFFGMLILLVAIATVAAVLRINKKPLCAEARPVLPRSPTRAELVAEFAIANRPRRIRRAGVTSRPHQVECCVGCT